MPLPLTPRSRLTRRLRFALATWALTWPVFAFADAVPRPPVADFARSPDALNMHLSPDGLSVAFLQEDGNHTLLCTSTLATGATRRFRIPDAPAFGTVVPREVIAFWWISDRRLIIVTTVWDALYGAAAVDVDGSHWRGLTGLEADPTGRTAPPAFELLYRFKDDSQRILMLDRRDALGTSQLHPHVIEINTVTGVSKTVVENPGNVTQWMSDHEGVIRLGLAAQRNSTEVRYRDSVDSPWRTLPLPSRGHEKLRAHAFDPQDGTFYVTGFNPEDRWTVFPFNLQDGTVGPPLLTDPIYDTIGAGYTPRFNGVSLTHLLFSAAHQGLIGAVYCGEGPKIQWFVPEYQKVQAAVDHALPGNVNLLIDESDDGQRLLFLSFSDRDPGTYHLLDRAARTFKPIGAARSWIKPTAMSSMFPIHFKARDGEEIHGYLTVPIGHPPKKLPLVVLPHGGPWIRDIWGFDPLVQLLASRGYAVLQADYRGSLGYGSRFELLGKQQVGRAIQTDIEDATKWAIAAGVADPARIAIVGASYGGYSALFAVGHSPDLYRCAVSLNGVTDWLAIFDRRSKDPLYRSAQRQWRENIGDPKEEPDFLAAISPINFAAQIDVPVLVVHGKNDRTVPEAQARAMVTALKKAGKPHEVLYLKDTGHNLANAKTRLEAFEALVTFLEQHLGPGVDYRPPST